MLNQNVKIMKTSLVKAAFVTVFLVTGLFGCQNNPIPEDPKITELAIKGNWVATYVYHVESRTEITSQLAGLRMNVTGRASEVNSPVIGRYKLSNYWIEDNGILKGYFHNADGTDDFNVEIANPNVTEYSSLTLVLYKSGNKFRNLSESHASGTYTIFLDRFQN
jgi:hypothetical protein